MGACAFIALESHDAAASVRLEDARALPVSSYMRILSIAIESVPRFERQCYSSRGVRWGVARYKGYTAKVKVKRASYNGGEVFFLVADARLS